MILKKIRGGKMFTGIIEETGRIESIVQDGDSAVITINARINIL